MKNHELVYARVRKGLTQADLAALIGVSRSSYNYKEVGKFPFRVTEIKKIAERLELNAQDIYTIFFEQ